jgi:pullulanase/glycogen debranching enzyme
MSFSTAILAALLGAVTTAGAGYYNDGNAILLDCTARDETLTTCLGYLDGIADAMQGNGINGFVACISVGVDNGQLRDVVNQFLRNNAPRRHFAAAGLIAHAFADAFPCR